MGPVSSVPVSPWFLSHSSFLVLSFFQLQKSTSKSQSKSDVWLMAGFLVVVISEEGSGRPGPAMAYGGKIEQYFES